MDIVLAYSGGLDTSVMIPWLKEHYNGKVVAMHTDVGQNDDIRLLKEKALNCGADVFLSIDITDELVNDGLISLAISGAKYDGSYPLGTSIARTMQAKKQVEIAHEFNCDAVAHGGTVKGNDQIRFEMMYYALDPSLKIIAPWKEWNLKSRYDELKYAANKGLNIDSQEHRFSEDINLWNHTYDGDYLEDISIAVDEDLYKWTKQNVGSNDVIKLDFKSGIPEKINDVEMSIKDIIIQLNNIGKKHKLGRTDMIENRIMGLKSRSIYEYPGADILYFAENELRHMILNRSINRFIDYSAVLYSDLLYDGYYYSRFAEILRNMFRDVMKNATGSIKLRIENNSISILSRESPYSLYDIESASYDINNSFLAKSAEGYIEVIREEFYKEYNIEVRSND